MSPGLNPGHKRCPSWATLLSAHSSRTSSDRELSPSVWAAADSSGTSVPPQAQPDSSVSLVPILMLLIWPQVSLAFYAIAGLSPRGLFSGRCILATSKFLQGPQGLQPSCHPPV